MIKLGQLMGWTVATARNGDQLRYNEHKGPAAFQLSEPGTYAPMYDVIDGRPGTFLVFITAQANVERYHGVKKIAPSKGHPGHWGALRRCCVAAALLLRCCCVLLTTQRPCVCRCGTPLPQRRPRWGTHGKGHRDHHSPGGGNRHTAVLSAPLRRASADRGVSAASKLACRVWKRRGNC